MAVGRRNLPSRIQRRREIEKEAAGGEQQARAPEDLQQPGWRRSLQKRRQEGLWLKEWVEKSLLWGWGKSPGTEKQRSPSKKAQILRRPDRPPEAGTPLQPRQNQPFPRAVSSPASQALPHQVGRGELNLSRGNQRVPPEEPGTRTSGCTGLIPSGRGRGRSAPVDEETACSRSWTPASCSSVADRWTPGLEETSSSRWGWGYRA